MNAKFIMGCKIFKSGVVTRKETISLGCCCDTTAPSSTGVASVATSV